MRIRYVAFSFVLCTLFWSAPAHAQTVTLYSQLDDSGEMLSPQATFQNTFITSASLGNLALGKDSLSITFTMKDPNASNASGQPAGVVIGTCATCQDLQKYLFTNADRTLLADGAFHTFTVQTGTTTLGIADGETPIYITFFGLSQYHNSTHLKSNAAQTIPYLIIEGVQPPPPVVPQAPEGSIAVYEQGDNTGAMTNPQQTFLNAYIDSASLGNVNVGQGKLYITFTMKDPNASNAIGTPTGICLQEASSTNCGAPLQMYRFTDSDRALLADQAFHTFMVETGTTTSTYADGTRPVSIGFFGLSQYQFGTKIKSNADATIPYLIIKKEPPPDPCATPGACVSNVLFLPGIKGSHLYRPKDGCDASISSCEDRLWEPGLDEGIFSSLLRGAGNDDVRDLFLNAQGASARSDIYVKEKDILDSVSGKNFYSSFIADMDALKADGTIIDWEPIAYDWRLSLSDIVEKGKKTGDRISYLEATSTPYIEQELRRLAASSKTGKVTIIAHSNGGLVSKSLMERLGVSESSALIDNLIFVGVPQSGAPRAVGSLLYGAGEGLPFERFDFLMSKAVAREFSEHSPMAYHLLPSAQYFADANDPSHAVGAFDGTAGFEKERAAYGSTLDTADELYDFLLAREGGREKPATDEVLDANILGETFIDYARATHTVADAWLPPSGVTLYQIAGWGIDTVAGLRFTSLPPTIAGPYAALHRSMFSPTFVEDGDGVIPVPSALMTSTSSPNVKRYWVNLKSFGPQANRKHGDLLEIADIREFIRNILENTESYPSTLLDHQPANAELNKKLIFILHSPLTLQLQDSAGNTTGLSGDDSVTQNIPDATYGEFGDVQYIIAPEGNYTLSMNGQASGTFSLEMQGMSGNEIISSTLITNVPTTASTLASLTVSGGLDTVSALTVDQNGDGTSVLTITPQIGETVTYEPPAPEPVVSSSGGGAVIFSIPVPVATTSTEAFATATSVIESVLEIEPIATDTPATVASARPLQTRQKSPAPAFEPPKKVDVNILQTASVYNASQQPVLKKLGSTVYNGLHRLWRGLKVIFLIQK